MNLIVMEKLQNWKVCPKCKTRHFGEPHRRFCHGTWFSRLMRNCPSGDHMHVTCLYCGYEEVWPA